MGLSLLSAGPTFTFLAVTGLTGLRSRPETGLFTGDRSWRGTRTLGLKEGSSEKEQNHDPIYCSFAKQKNNIEQSFMIYPFDAALLRCASTAPTVRDMIYGSTRCITLLWGMDNPRPTTVTSACRDAIDLLCLPRPGNLRQRRLRKSSTCRVRSFSADQLRDAGWGQEETKNWFQACILDMSGS